MSDIVIPAVKIPLYAELGLTEKESNTVYFEVQELLQTYKTNAEILKKIADNPQWNTTMKVWASYNLYKEILKAKAPVAIRPLIDKLGF